MIPTDTPLVLAECYRCGDLVFTGRADGLLWRVDRHTIPREHATVLRRYGTPVLVIDRSASGRLVITPWTPHHDLTAARRYLGTTHVCGSAHARGSETP